MKWLGVLLVTVSLCSIGFWQTSRLITHRKELDRLVRFIRLTQEKIQLGQIETERIIRELHETRLLGNWQFLSDLCKSLDEGRELPEGFSMAARQYGKRGVIAEGDLSRLLEFGALLGTGDLEGELSRCGIYEAYFTKRLNQTEEEQKRKTPLYQTLWCCLGILMGVLLL